MYSAIDELIKLLNQTNDFSAFPQLKQFVNEYVRYRRESGKDDIGSLPLMRFSIYRLSSKLANRELREFECDCCKNITESYLKTYGWLREYICTEQNGKIAKFQLYHEQDDSTFKGDTMTSAFTPIKEYIKLKNGIKYTSSKDEDWECYWLKNYGDIVISAAASEFLDCVYSVGNFLPVPRGFNSGRSNWGKWDSWDLTLSQIYSWYMDNQKGKKDDSALTKLFTHSVYPEYTVRNCKAWLEMFGSWDEFINANYMFSFLNTNGLPRRFFQNHTLEYGLPKTLEEYEEFFVNASFCIRERETLIYDDK